MFRVRHITAIDECREVWNEVMPSELLSDLWEIRNCFHVHYRHRPKFVVAEEAGRIVGFLPLSWNPESGQYNYFPGETWEGKTWLEQNRVIAPSREILDAMLASLDGPYHLRYLRNDALWMDTGEKVDEIGYLFIPENYGYSVDRYLESFSHKTAKKLRKELDGWSQRTIEYRTDRVEDFELLCGMNRSRFGRLSYFYDERFLGSFRTLVKLLNDRGWLRIVTVLVDGVPAAVDLGSLYKEMLTMLAGGTNQAYPGIAKLINMHHITTGCKQKLDSVDFLCGDFNWKTLFHLSPSPLYMIEGGVRSSIRPTVATAHYSSWIRPFMGLGRVPYAR